jgi:hypothetical protein
MDSAKSPPSFVGVALSGTRERTAVNHTEVSRSFWQEIEFRDGLILSVAWIDGPPAGWDDATPLDLGLTPDTGT